MEFVGDGSHNGTNGEAVEIVIHKDQATETCSRGKSTCFAFDAFFCPFAVSFGTAGFLHQNGKNTKDHKEKENRNHEKEVII
mgnify:CR=1 FL=1